MPAALVPAAPSPAAVPGLAALVDDYGHAIDRFDAGLAALAARDLAELVDASGLVPAVAGRRVALTTPGHVVVVERLGGRPFASVLPIVGQD